ncbi:MAG: heme ABC transporter ATP-binding protein [Bdellovibrionales bacterium RIFOXYD1_FULL_44_7]|nr:MAG: heme ABC transporter ATP-binding protein [Bdellovibrionales bacterium RIFOXYD1_FULL_44_7]
MSDSPSSYAVELSGLTKVFDTVIANDNVNFKVRPGTIHGIVGENGAGKSTAMKMLYGVYRPTSGAIILNGKKCDFSSPLDAIKSGIGMVHQHFMLAGPYSALDNIILGAEPGYDSLKWMPKLLNPISRKKARQKIERLVEQYGLSVDLDVAVEDLPVGVQQRIEILKLLYRDARILILDEPTAVLTPQETNDLFLNLKRLKNEGKTILVITHKLKEVIGFTDRVTVFRAGKVTGEVETSETNAQELAGLMVGRKISLQIDVPMAENVGRPVLAVKGLTLRGMRGSARHRLFDVTFEVYSGEIVGIAGVEGNGQSQLLQALVHPNESACRSAGLVKIFDSDVTEMGAEKIKALGVGFIPEDRHKEGLLLSRPLNENFLLGLQRTVHFSRFGLLANKRVIERTKAAINEYDVRPGVISATSGSLSGGNQQKLIIAREFERNPKLLIAAQPTRGVDVGAIEFIHRNIVKARDEGAAVLLISSELDEIVTLSDRIYVMYEGQLVGHFSRETCTEKDLGLRMAGHFGVEGSASKVE